MGGTITKTPTSTAAATPKDKDPDPRISRSYAKHMDDYHEVAIGAAGGAGYVLGSSMDVMAPSIPSTTTTVPPVTNPTAPTPQPTPGGPTTGTTTPGGVTVGTRPPVSGGPTPIGPKPSPPVNKPSTTTAAAATGSAMKVATKAGIFGAIFTFLVSGVANLILVIRKKETWKQAMLHIGLDTGFGALGAFGGAALAGTLFAGIAPLAGGLGGLLVGIVCSWLIVAGAKKLFHMFYHGKDRDPVFDLVGLHKHKDKDPLEKLQKQVDELKEKYDALVNKVEILDEPGSAQQQADRTEARQKFKEYQAKKTELKAAKNKQSVDPSEKDENKK